MAHGIPSWRRDARRFGARVICALMLCAPLFATYAGGARAAEPQIEVHGNRRVDTAAIRGYFRLGRDGRLDAAAQDAALKDLFASGAFEDVKITQAGGRIIVTVVEAPIIARVQFEGNKQIKDEDLTKEIQSKALAPFSKSTVQSDVVRITDIYRQTGRYQAQVTPSTIAHGEGRVDLVFEIKEGDKTGVKSITFVGNQAFPAARLKNVIKTTESGLLSFLKSSDVYDPDRIQADAELLRVFYLKNGYADVRVVPGVAVYDQDQKGFTVAFTIDEGERYTFGAIAIESHLGSRLQEADLAALRGTLRIATGAVFNGDALDKAGDDIAIAVSSRGYPFAVVRPHLARTVAAHLVDVAFTIDDGPHNYVERIVIRGNTVTRDEVIRREFDIAEGDAYNRALVDRAERRLRALPMLKSAKITTDPGSASDRVVLNVDVSEAQTGDLSFAGGYSTSAGIIGEVTVSERNFMGTGQFVKLSVTAGQFLRGGNFTFVQPYLLGNRMSLGVDLFYKQTLTNVTQAFGSTNYGTTLRVDAPLMEGVTAEARYSISSQSVSLAPAFANCIPPNAAQTCASAPVKQAALNGPVLISAIGSSLIYSTLDNPRSPHEGVKATISQDLAGLGGVDFFKTTADVRVFHDIGNDVVASLRGQGGYIMPYGGQTLPLTSGFFGGPQLVRGFAPNGFGPRDLTPGTTQDNIGGTRYWATSAELQAPIPLLPPEVALRVAGFGDAGSLYGYRGQTSFPALAQSLTLADSRQVRASVGAGLVWDSPFGALRVDYAIPIAKTNYDVTQRVFFGFGGF